MGVFKQINFIGLGVQIDVFATEMTDVQMGIFCLVGAVATLVWGYVLVLLCDKLCLSKSKLFKAVMYYITIALLLLAPIYLSILCSFFGGGGMNGISLLLPELVARIGFGVLFAINGFVFWRVILPKYTKAFQEER